MAFRLRAICSVVILLCMGIPAFANSFDLAGPTLESTVTRGKMRLPISEVPNLQAGDRVWIQANFPSSQSVRYLMVVVFLRGSTNPPPDNWFHKDETWKGRGSEGLTLTVPKGARQMLVLLAPETGGAYHTLVNAVERKPGSFVRASQDLNEAMLDRSRLDTYLRSIRRVNASNPARLQTVAPMLARSLSIKLDNTCFDAVSEEQAPCLMHDQNSLVMNDSQSDSITDTLTQGPVSTLAMQVSSTPSTGFGYYSPYIASVMDIARVMSSFHSPQYQYIPALAMRKEKAMHLMLNTPPSFGKQKSVIVAAMPAVQSPQLPLLHAVSSSRMECAEKPGLVLQAEGAPLVFATGYAHGMALRLRTKSGKVVELPAQTDVEQGGFVVDTKGLDARKFGNPVVGTLHGYWGFVPYGGPEYTLTNAHSQPWMLAAGEANTLVVGRDAEVHLHASDAACVEQVAVKSGGSSAVATQWKVLKPGELEVSLPLKSAQPGTMTLLVHQYGLAQPETVTLQSFAKAAELKSFTLHAGDEEGELTGTRLNEVATLEVNGVKFAAEKMNSTGALVMKSTDPEEYKTLVAGSSEAHVRLKDGRVLTTKATIEGRRPEVKLLAKSVEPDRKDKSNIDLADQNELPQTATMRFSVKAEIPARFDRGEALEVATTDSVFSTTLTMQNGGLTLQDLHTAVATLRPSKAFGESAFGPLQFRVVDKGVAGAWQPLVTLVRLPELKTLQCGNGTDASDTATTDASSQAVAGTTCELTGDNLFLVDAVATDPSFQHEVQVPDGFPGETLAVPQPAAGQLYVKLRDDPAAVNMIALKNVMPAVKPKAKAKRKTVHEKGSEVQEAKKPLQIQPGGPMIPAQGPGNGKTVVNPAASAVAGPGTGSGSTPDATPNATPNASTSAGSVAPVASPKPAAGAKVAGTKAAGAAKAKPQEKPEGGSAE